jgi:hypothetical protein
MRFNLAPGSTQDDYNKARIECGDSPSGGYFLFGPLIILAPVVAAVESVKFAKRHELQDCLEGKGYRCIENCAHVSQYLEREKQGQLSLEKQDLERQKALDIEREQLAAERRKVDAEKLQMESLKRDQQKPSPPAENETKEIVMGPRPSASSANEIKRDGLFIAYENGTVLDTSTNLMWAAKDSGSDINWAEKDSWRNINWANAKSYSQNYHGGGYTDWRMPTLNELAGLYASGAHNDKIKITGFVWTSETRGSDAVLFSFFDGKRDWSPQPDDYGRRALPVRSGKYLVTRSAEKQSQPPLGNTKLSVDADQRNKGIKGIVLMNGKVIEGQILRLDPDTVKIRTKDGKDLSYDFKKEVKRFITE